MMHIFSTKNSYVITDGISFVQTFLVRKYSSRQACFFDASSTALSKETLFGFRNASTYRGRIVRKVGIVHGNQGPTWRQNQVQV